MGNRSKRTSYTTYSKTKSTPASIVYTERFMRMSILVSFQMNYGRKYARFGKRTILEKGV